LSIADDLNLALTEIQIQQLMELSGLNRTKVKDALALVQPILHIHARDDDEKDLGEWVTDPSPGPDQIAVEAEAARLVRSAVARLPTETAEVIKARFGMLTGMPMTISEVAEYLETSDMRVRSLLRAGLSQLRHDSQIDSLANRLATDEDLVPV